jgi:hypothetical protein
MRHIWILGGEVSLAKRKAGWSLKMPAQRNGLHVVDFELDTAYVVKFDIIGVEFEEVTQHCTVLTGWIHPNGPETFCVVDDPEFWLKDGRETPGRYGDDPVWAIESMTPSPNTLLYRRLASHRIKIEIGPPPVTFDPLQVALEGPLPGF